jgi:hypothetical protein
VSAPGKSLRSVVSAAASAHSAAPHWLSDDSVPLIIRFALGRRRTRQGLSRAYQFWSDHLDGIRDDKVGEVIELRTRA